MTYPIITYGNNKLRKLTEKIDENYSDLNELIGNMLETMYSSNGIGLAAPQIGRSISLFVVGTKLLNNNENFEKVFINPVITNRVGIDEYRFESCLSLPNIEEQIKRKSHITIEYYDKNFEFRNETHNGILSRIIQHEYDHLNGRLIIDYLHPVTQNRLKKKLLNKKK